MWDKISSLVQSFDQFWNWTTQDPMTLYSSVLTVLSSLLALIALMQGYFLLQVHKTARVNAETAKRTAEATLKLELPIIRVIPPVLYHLHDDERQDSYMGVPQIGNLLRVSPIKVVNRGRTDAEGIAIGLGWQVAEKLVGIPSYGWTMKFEPGTVFPPGFEHSLKIPDFLMELTDSARSVVNERTSHLWLYGYVSYLDFMNDRHEVRFCWRLHWRMDAANRQIRPDHLYVDPEVPAQYLHDT